MAVDTTPIQAIYDRLSQVSAFHPGTTEIFDDFLQEAGDVISLVSGSETFNFPIFAQHMKWTGSMLTSMESTGNETRNELPPLQRRAKNRGYGAGQRITEQGVIYETEFIKTNRVIGMEARAMGVLLDANGNPMVDPNDPNEFLYDTTSSTGAKIYSNLSLTANRASLISAINDVSGTQISGSKIDLSAQGTVLIQAINLNNPSQTSIRLQAAQINLEGYVQASQISAEIAVVDALTATTGYAQTIYSKNFSATSTVSGITGDFTNSVYAQHYYVTNSAGDTDYQLGNSVTAFGSTTSDPTTGQVSIPYYTSAHPWGSSSPAGNITFNIADMAFYQNHIGISSTGSWTWDADAGSGDGAYVRTITPKAGNPATIDFPAVTASAGIAYNSSTHTYSASAVARYGGRDVSSAAYATSGVEAYEDGQRSVTLTYTDWDYDSSNEVVYAKVDGSSPNTQSRTIYPPPGIFVADSGSWNSNHAITIAAYCTINGSYRYLGGNRTLSAASVYNEGWSHCISSEITVSAPDSATLNYDDIVYVSVTARNPNGTNTSILSRTYVAPSQGGGGSYAQGWNALVEAADTSSYVQYSGASSVSSSLSKSNGTIDGYIWLKDYSGTWQRRRHLTVSYPNDSYNKSVTLTYKGSVNGVYTYTTSTYVSGLTTNARYTVHFNA